MKTTHLRIVAAVALLGVLAGWALAAPVLDRPGRPGDPNGVVDPNRPVDPNRVHGTLPSSPHRAPNLVGLAHINLADRQEAAIEEIVRGNQGGLRAAAAAIRQATAALEAAKRSARESRIELAAFELGQAIGQQAVVRTQMVQAILEVLTEKQLDALAEFNAQTRRWQELGLLSAPERPDRPDGKTVE